MQGLRPSARRTRRAVCSRRRTATVYQCRSAQARATRGPKRTPRSHTARLAPLTRERQPSARRRLRFRRTSGFSFSANGGNGPTPTEAKRRKCESIHSRSAARRAELNGSVGVCCAGVGKANLAEWNGSRLRRSSSACLRLVSRDAERCRFGRRQCTRITPHGPSASPMPSSEQIARSVDLDAVAVRARIHCACSSGHAAVREAGG